MEPFERSRVRLSFLGAVSATAYVAAALSQALIRGFFLGPEASPVQAIAVRCQVADQVRAILVLASIFLSLVVFAAIAVNRMKHSPGAVLLGLSFGILFVAMEIWYRAIDLFLVSRVWAHAYAEARDPGVKERLLDKVSDWEHLVEALYFSLLLALLVSVASFAVSLAGDRTRWVRLAGVGWGLYGTSVLLRILGAYGGLGWLEAFNRHAYLPCAMAGYGFTAVWLWHEGRPWTDSKR